MKEVLLSFGFRPLFFHLPISVELSCRVRFRLVARQDIMEEIGSSILPCATTTRRRQ
jgi:hypothetical protein